MKNPTFWKRLRFAYQAFKNYPRVLDGLPVAIEVAGGSPSAMMEALDGIRYTYVTHTGEEIKKTLRLF